METGWGDFCLALITICLLMNPLSVSASSLPSTPVSMPFVAVTAVGVCCSVVFNACPVSVTVFSNLSDEQRP